MGKKKKYFTEEERKAARKKVIKRYNDRHYEDNYNTPIGRARYLVNTYNQEDKRRRGCKGDLTAQWVVDNIFTQPCAHCGKTGWNVIGCNRLDNSKPHSIDNVEPCCEKCNKDLAVKDLQKQNSKTVYQYDLNTMELIGVYQNSVVASQETKIATSGNIRIFCQGGYFDKKRNKWVNTKQIKGYIFSYKPL